MTGGCPHPDQWDDPAVCPAPCGLLHTRCGVCHAPLQPCPWETQVTATRTPSQRGRMSRNKGARWERAVANAIKPYWPNAQRSRDNGSTTTLDTGDIAGTGPGLFWSLKDDESGDMGTPSVISAWLDDAWTKADGRLPLLVQKRRGRADPMVAWCWLPMRELIALAYPDVAGRYAGPAATEPVRMEFRHVIQLLIGANYALIGIEEAAS